MHWYVTVRTSYKREYYMYIPTYFLNLFIGMPRLGNRCPPSTTTGRPAWRRGRGRGRRGDTGQHRRARQQADRRRTAGVHQRAERPQRLPQQRRRRKARRRRGGQPGAGQGHLPQQARVQLPAKLPKQPAGGGAGVSEIIFPIESYFFPHCL